MKARSLIAVLWFSIPAGCKPPSSSPSPQFTLSWSTAPTPIMVRQYDPVAPTLPCVTVTAVNGPPGNIKGAPLKGIDVKLGKNPGGGLANRTTDENGQAAFCGIPSDPGTYSLTATADGAAALQSDPFLIPEATVALTWTVQPAVSVLGQPLAGEDGGCPTVTATQLVDSADGGAPPVPYLVEGAPLKGIDVKLGKNPGGGCAARTLTDENGVAQFCNVVADQLGSVTYTAALSLLDGGDVPEQFDPLYSPTARVDSVPVYVSPNQYVLQWTGQPPSQNKAGEMISATAAQACKVGVTIYNTSELTDGGTAALPVEVAGMPAPGVAVTFQQVPVIGSPVTVTTDDGGVATLCGSSFTFSGVDNTSGAYAIQASTPGAQPKYSVPFVVAE